MTEVTKAKLTKLKVKQPPKKGAPSPAERDGAAIEVQFNPTSLKLSRTNNVDTSGGTTRGPARQNPSAAPATLAFDLEFDTAEGDQDGQPLDVRSLTKQVRQFVEPNRDKPAEAPPRVLFEWGALAFAGIITQLTEDLDYFAPDGQALRAKLSITITEQNLRFEINEQSSGARTDPNATRPGDPAPGGNPGSSGSQNPTRATPANQGESLQQLLTRLDEDPSAWRSAMNGLKSPLGLAAGAQVQVAAGASVGLGLGVAAGFQAGASAGAAVGAALGVGAGASAGVSAGVSVGPSAGAGFGGSVGVAASGFAGASAQARAGFVLSAAGGVGAATNLVLAAGSDAAVASARASFGLSATTGVSASLGVSATVREATGAAIDPRAVGYGASIPLRARPSVHASWDATAGGSRNVGARSSSVELDFAAGVGPAWERLPAVTSGRAAADGWQRSRDAGPTTMRWRPGR